MTVTRANGALIIGRTKTLIPARSQQGFWGLIRESFTGAWQKNIEVDTRSAVLAFSAVYSCVAIIAGDIAKLRVKLTELTRDGIWIEVTRNSPFAAPLETPNRFQTRVQFFEYWMTSILLWGNAYILKERDARGMVTDLYVLNPERVTPCVAEDGSVWYQLQQDYLAGTDACVVSSEEIIHDRINCLFHPLVGISPIYACGASATQGNRIQNQSAKFFENMSRPSGMLTAPASIDDETAARMKREFEKNFGGQNIGRLFVAGSGLKYEGMTMPAHDAQLIEQLKWTVEDVARCFHVPLYMLGAAPIPGDRNIEAMMRLYYNQALQRPIEGMECVLDRGLYLPSNYATEFDLDALLRMDMAARYAAYKTAIDGAWMAPNEARYREDMAPVDGGEEPIAQQQNWPLSVLAKRPPPTDPGSGATPATLAPIGAVPALPAPADASDQDTSGGEAGKSLTESEITARAAAFLTRDLEAA